MAKLTKDQKRKKKLAAKAKKKNIVPVTLKPKELKKSFILSKVRLNEETGQQERVDCEIKAEKAEILIDQEKLCDGRIREIKPKYKPQVTAWDYFGVAASNYFHAAYEECDRLIVQITPNELPGTVVAFPDYDDRDSFDTDTILVSTELDPSFNFSDEETVSAFETFFAESILPVLKNMPNTNDINKDYKMRSYHIFKAFNKYWCAGYLRPQSQLKGFEKKTSKSTECIYGESYDSKTYVENFENPH